MKKKTNISNKTLKLINQQQIRLIPKWEFVVKNWALWLGLVVCLTLLVLGVSVSWFGLADNIITPYLWLFIASAFLALSYLLFEKTKKAYRFQKWQVVISISIIGLIVGGILFKTGLGSRIDRNLESNLPYYRQMVPMKMVVWNNPKSGYLSGEIINIIDANSFKIKDFNNNTWIITSQDPLIIRGKVQIIVGEKIKLIGNQTENNTFKVDEIRPWGNMGKT